MKHLNMQALTKTFLLLAVFSLFFSCKPEKNGPGEVELQLHFTAGMGNQPLEFLQDYQHPMGYHYEMELLYNYFDNVTLENTAGELVEIKDILLVKYNEEGAASSRENTVLVPKDEYKRIHFGVGVGSERNNADPSVYAAAHPLSIFHGTHWDWNSGYIFTKIEGRFNNEPNVPGNYNRSLNYHIGENDLYNIVMLDLPSGFAVTDNQNTITIHLDLKNILENSVDLIDFNEDNSTHTLNDFELAERVANLLKVSFSVK